MIYGEITNGSVVDHGVRKEYEVRLGYKLNNQDVEQNLSNITLQLEVRSINSNYYSYGFQQTTTIDGVKLSAKTFDMRPVNTWKVFGTRTFDVLHDENREYKATKTASFTTNANLEWTLKSGSASVEIELEKLHTPPSINGLEVEEQNTTINSQGSIVQYLSKKRIVLDVSTYEEAKMVGSRVYQNGVLLTESTTTEVIIDFSNVENLLILKEGERKYCVLTFEVTDDFGSVGILKSQFEVIEYFKPNLIQTSSNIKRNGQASGKVKLNLVGVFFNEYQENIGNTIKLKFAYWKRNETESSTYYEIPFETNDNNINITDYSLSIDGKEIESINKDSAYFFKIKATDKFNNESEITLLCSVGEYVWAEYKDRVDFKNITLKNTKLIENGSNDNGSWIKLFDGTMICYWQSGVPGGGTGGFSVKANAVTTSTLQFPETFSSEPVVMPILMSGSSSATVGYITVSAWSVTTTQFQYRFYSKDSASREPNYGYIAIGRWKE